MLKPTVALTLALAACTKAPIPPTERPASDASMAALAALMKNQINPAFSKLTFLVFHQDELQEDPNAVRVELERTAMLLRSSIGELRTWQEPPTESREGRDVFYTYAASVETQAQQLFDAVQRRDNTMAATQMQDMADTCNNCHHFFRLKIEDSVVPR
ncbi:MAG: cytochrome c [Kofleriaceae bacterium]